MLPIVHKVAQWGLLVSIALTVLCAILMGLPGQVGHFFKEIHAVFGWAMVAFAAFHLYEHRQMLKMMLKKRVDSVKK